MSVIKSNRLVGWWKNLHHRFFSFPSRQINCEWSHWKNPRAPAYEKWKKSKRTNDCKNENWLRKRDVYTPTGFLIRLQRRFNACPSVAMPNNVIISFSSQLCFYYACMQSTSSTLCVCRVVILSQWCTANRLAGRELSKAFNYSHRMDCFRAHHNHICNHRVSAR